MAHDYSIHLTKCVPLGAIQRTQCGKVIGGRNNPSQFKQTDDITEVDCEMCMKSYRAARRRNR